MVREFLQHLSTSSQVTHIVQYSGGVGSFAAAKWVVDHYGRDRVVLLFTDTLIEDEDLYRFLEESSHFLGVPVTRIADGRTPWEVFRDRRFLGNSRVDLCSRILKREQALGWVKKHFPLPVLVKIYVGIDWTEAHRMKNVHALWDPYPIIAPLVDTNFDKLAFMEEMKGWGISLPRLYTMGFQHNNCGGFCVKAGKAHFLNLLQHLPERYAHHEERERRLGAWLVEEGKKPYTILKETVRGKDRYISLQELRERQAEVAATEDGQLDWGGCGCFNDIGEDELCVQ